MSSEGLAITIDGQLWLNYSTDGTQKRGGIRTSVSTSSCFLYTGFELGMQRFIIGPTNCFFPFQFN